MLIHDWSKFPLKYDPSRGYSLCKSCWNGQHWNPPYRDDFGVKHNKTSNCLLPQCQCGCKDKGPKRIKFTGEGQTSISMDNPLDIK